MARNRLWLPLATCLFILFLLVPVQVMVERPMLLLERFVPGGGWFQMALFALYGAIVAYYMQDPARVARWRKYTWLAFSIVFFSQLILGLLGYEMFLMTGKLHLPVPMMIMAGPLYRGQLSVMTILFVSTVFLSGPAWCSHLCYFGAIDSISSGGKTRRSPMRNKWALKFTTLFLVAIGALALRWLKVPAQQATWLAIGFGVVGLAIILLVSKKEGRMVHCTAWCPIGTVVNLTRHINPFRLTIDNKSCTSCMACTATCKYDALNKEHIDARKPGATCTLCGDCLSSCHAGSINYRFPGLPASRARMLYLLITITLHAATMALARI
jgi:ferredoxin-type protein NapH